MGLTPKKKLIIYISFIFLLFSFASTVYAKQNPNKVRTFKVTKLEKRNNKVIYRKFLDTSVPYIGAATMHESNITGKGYSIVVIDSGINSTHPMISGKVILEACFTSQRSCPNSTNKQIGKGAAAPIDWHGTHVSGIALGRANDIVGVAPDATLIAVNVFDKDDSSSESSITQALNWVLSISSEHKIASVNMSLGSSRTYNNYCDDIVPSMTSAIHKLYDKNIPVVVAAGNSYSLGMANPACISKVVSVAAMTENGSITSFSNLSDKTTFAAPGYQIKSSAEGSNYRVASGTSMSSPHVAGAFALYKQVHPQHDLPTTIANLLSISTSAYDPYSKIVVPAINVSRLLETTNTPSTTILSTTTIPVSVPSDILVPTIPLEPIKPSFKPYLNKVYTPSMESDFFYIKYQDSFAPKASVQNYVLDCYTIKYNIPVESSLNNHVYRIDSPPNISSCFMYAILKDQTLSAYSTPVFLSKG